MDDKQAYAGLLRPLCDLDPTNEPETTKQLGREAAKAISSLLKALEVIADVWSLPAVPMKAGGEKWHCQHEEWMAAMVSVARAALNSDAPLSIGEGL